MPLTKKPKPAASKTIPAIRTEPVAFRCLHCGSSNVVELGQLQSTDFAGMIGDRAFSRIDRYRVVCSDCDKPSIQFVRV